MSIDEVRTRVLQIFRNVGVIVEPAGEGDINLQNYIADSLQFISAIVEIENEFDIELPDDLLLYDRLASFHAFSNAIWELCNERDSVNI